MENIELPIHAVISKTHIISYKSTYSKVKITRRPKREKKSVLALYTLFCRFCRSLLNIPVHAFFAIFEKIIIAFCKKDKKITLSLFLTNLHVYSNYIRQKVNNVLRELTYLKFNKINTEINNFIPQLILYKCVCCI